MFLSKLKLTNFRSFQEEEISFCKDLTVCVGENNGGKSNAIDAIRLITAPLGLRRDLYCETSDLRFGAPSSSFEIETTYEDLNPAQQGRLISASLNHDLRSARFRLTVDTASVTSLRPALTAGAQNHLPEPGCADAIRHVYLPPLRDAKRALASGNPTRIMALLKHFLAGEQPEDLARRLRRINQDPVLSRLDIAVAANLEKLTSGVRRQGSALGFSDDEKLIDIARDLRFKLADHGIVPEDLRYSGHGYANLLYMATIAVELEKVKLTDLTLFLVEEPEAHLHPQLQAAVLGFLEDQAARSKRDQAAEGPAGQIQVIVATHSPNLSAWVTSSNLVVFRSMPAPPNDRPEDRPIAEPERPADAQRDQRELEAAEIEAVVEAAVEGVAGVPVPPPAVADPGRAAQSRRITRCIPLHKIDISDPDRKKVDRYLDVTRSSVLFGGRALLVEGIAEAILLPVIAKKFVLREQPERLRLFRSAVYVPIDGVDFAPYLKLLLSPFNNSRIAEKVVLVTDGDAHTVEAGGELPGTERRARFETLVGNLGARDFLHVETNTYSLETELVASGNAAILGAAYLALHPRSRQRWAEAVALADRDRAVAIQNLFKDTPKGDFAQLVAEALQADDVEFTVPPYLRRAIEALVT